MIPRVTTNAEPWPAAGDQERGPGAHLDAPARRRRHGRGGPPPGRRQLAV